jgi:hypothetical protein
MSGLREVEKFVKDQNISMKTRYLMTAARPNIVDGESEYPGTAWDEDYIRVRFEDIEEWADFGETNANRAFFRVLDNAVQSVIHLRTPFAKLEEPLSVVYEEDIDKLFLDSIGPILSHNFECNRKLLQQLSGNDYVSKLRIPWTKEAVKIELPGKTKNDNTERRPKRPNFPVYVPAKSMPRMTPAHGIIFVVGEAARLKALKPISLMSSKDFKDHAENHIGKLAMYCYWGKTCLAFTMTVTGVTVFRFFTIPDGNSNVRLGLQYKSFPWSPNPVPTGAENEMSGMKAIWTIIHMSIHPAARKIKSRDELLSLKHWPQL